MTIIEHIISALAPHQCVQCGLEGPIWCHDCSFAAPPAPPCCYKCAKPDAPFYICASCKPAVPLERVYVAMTYEGAAETLVHKLKFERAGHVALTMAYLLAREIDAGRYDVITYAPTATSRRRQRGYDQAERIARLLAAQLKLPFDTLLLRSGQKRQLGAGRQQRLKQLQHSFRAAHTSLPHKRILLVDDVLTTGSTLETGAQVLLEGGAYSVDAAAFAIVQR